MNNITELLRNAPKGYKLYSPMWGVVYFNKICDNDSIKVTSKHQDITGYFNQYGQYYEAGECLLFPSKEVREWDNFTLKKEKEYIFKPFDKVIVRDNKLDTWTIDFFSYKDKSCEEAPYTTINGWYTYCLPYNEETAKLIGTTNDY